MVHLLFISLIILGNLFVPIGGVRMFFFVLVKAFCIIILLEIYQKRFVILQVVCFFCFGF